MKFLLRFFTQYVCAAIRCYFRYVKALMIFISPFRHGALSRASRGHSKWASSFRHNTTNDYKRFRDWRHGGGGGRVAGHLWYADTCYNTALAADAFLYAAALGDTAFRAMIGVADARQ